MLLWIFYYVGFLFGDFLWVSGPNSRIAGLEDLNSLMILLTFQIGFWNDQTNYVFVFLLSHSPSYVERFCLLLSWPVLGVRWNFKLIFFSLISDLEDFLIWLYHLFWAVHGLWLFIHWNDFGWSLFSKFLIPVGCQISLRCLLWRLLCHSSHIYFVYTKAF